jgi:N-methylhydantoinase A/oxoprolinase/acetone carboxylase beta subunit
MAVVGEKRKVRVGIDVGGTFTDVAVVDNDTREVVAQLKVPTTHDAQEGVARGIIAAIERALAELNIAPDEVIFIAHSTTQATNALLEGDVAQVGIVGMGQGLEGWKARLDTKIPPIELAPGRWFAPSHRFVSKADAALADVVAALREKGAEVIVASEAFGVDHTENEELVTNLAREQGLLATAGHEVATLYGLRSRTRTAALNAAILPKMVHTATMTDACVKQAGITAPLMIMRSDGGVMSVEEVHRRPIMTMLSGPAAGIAGALMHERVSDGIFIEVGGTSADISVIRDGQPQTKAARVGGHRTFLHTLDVRTLAIAGGSMARERGGKIVDVGPRSAHIAGLPYAVFAADAAVFDGAKLVHLKPTPQDADDYVAIECADGSRHALTPTCAANLLGYVPEGAFARGHPAAARAAFAPLAAALGVSAEDAARQILESSCRQVAQQIEQLIVEYKLERATVELVGGGGGAAALVPFAGELLGLPARLARKAEVISTIGVALAMVRDVVERNIVDPAPEDILRVRREAAEAVIQAGALPETVEVQVEVDTRRNLVRATAFGTTELKKDDGAGGVLDVDGCRAAAARSMQVETAQVALLGRTAGLYVFGARLTRQTLFGLFRQTRQALRVTDKTGVVLLQRSRAEAVNSTVSEIAGDLEAAIMRLTDFGDAGRALPDIHVLTGSRIVNLSGLADAEQALALAQTELENLPPEEQLVIVAAPRNA